MAGISKFKVTSEIRAILLADEKIVSLVGDNIFPLNAEKDTKGDFIIYMRDEYSIERCKMGIASQKCNVYINAISASYNRSQDLADLIFNALDGVFKNPDIVIHLEDSTEDYADGKYIQVLLFSIE